MQKVLITSSGTGIGKTLITCALTTALKSNGKKVHALKPVISGFNPNIVPNDVFHICEALNINYIKSAERVCMASFLPPLSPDMAARMFKEKQVDFTRLLKFCEGKAHEKKDFLLIETVGGIAVPLNDEYTTLDLIKKLKARVILVAGNYLGSLSHTISAYMLLDSVGRRPDVLIVTENTSIKSKLYVPLDETIKSLENFIPVPIIAVEKLSGSEKNKIEKLSAKFADEQIITGI